MRDKKVETSPRVRINTVVTGKPARWLIEWKRRGIIKSYTDAVIQGLRSFSQMLTEQDIKLAQLRRSLSSVDSMTMSLIL